ncbi:MAG: hypothetical protein GY822_31355 [Deltaproteobacteria bacterium]|nr:hypothetical protein [Deltaproteobacteria bacterium]
MTQKTSSLTDRLSAQSGTLLVVFCICLALLNFGRLDEWGEAGFRIYFTQAIMQTTLFDFAWVLGILLVFIHQDARRHGLSYAWILPTFPFMPTLGLLLYFWVRHRKMSRTRRNDEVQIFLETNVRK